MKCELYTLDNVHNNERGGILKGQQPSMPKDVEDEPIMLQYSHLSRSPKVFQTLTGLRVAEFDTLLDDVQPRYAESEEAGLSRADRQRDLGGGHPFALE